MKKMVLIFKIIRNLFSFNLSVCGMANETIIWAYSPDLKTTFALCIKLTGADNEQLFDYLFDLKFKLSPCSENDWTYYTDYPTKSIMGFFVGDANDVVEFKSLVMEKGG